MDEGTKARQSRPQRLLIERPRLTKLLDESEARVILLLAPAGYGKTTLAREWLRDTKGVAWYNGGAAMADVAALATGLADAFVTACPSSRGLSDGERFKILASSGQRPAALAQALAPIAANCAALVVEDYHHLMEAEASEQLVSALLAATTFRLVVTSRARPTWCSARMSIYGEAAVLDAAHLAFTDDEARQVLSESSTHFRERILSRARGWPAVIGLAAAQGEAVEPRVSLQPDGLYRFFAEELFRRAPTELQRALLLLAIGGDADAAVTSDLLGNEREKLLAAGTRAGFLTTDLAVLVDMHPLLKGFLIQKAHELPAHETNGLVARVVAAAAAHHHWDQCLAALTEFPQPELVTATLESAIHELLDSGRVATLKRWLSLGTSLRIQHTIFTLAEAEVALREGENEKAQVLGERAGERLGLGDAAARAYLVAARAAHLREDGRSATRNALQAETVGERLDTKVAALWLHFAGALERKSPHARNVLARLQAIPDESAGHAVRLRNGEGFVLLEIQRDARAAIREYELGRTLLPQVHDPFLRTAFLNQHAYVLATLARYDDALEIARELIIEARASGLEFAVHHALVTRATAFVGTRQLRAAQRTLDQLDGAAERPAEHVLANANLQLAKLRIALGDLDRASRLLHVRPSLTMSVSFKQELLAYRAVVDAARGDLDAATAALEEGATEAVYGATIGVRKFAAAIVELRNDSDRAPTAALTAMQFAIARGFIDGAVSACRAYPELARHAATQDADSASQLAEIFRRTRDSDLGRRAGLTMPRELHRNEGLSVREREVYEHLIQGRTNREIAAALFISESTTKVHVRHIFEKLGVHSRAEAARLAGRLDGETRAAVMSHIEDPDR